MTDPYFVKTLKYNAGGADSGTITWETPDPDDASTSQVEYWAEDVPMETTPRDDRLVHNHRVELTGLKPCTTYSYRVISTRPNKTNPSVGTGTFDQPPVPRFNWEGFFSPVNNPPAINEVNAGRTIPVKFRLGGDRGLNIFAGGYPKSEGTATAGSLSYDARENQYTYLWRTDRAWSGRRELLLKLGDCSEHRANFEFK
jgi:hypothetical protein